jgi:O-antigen/teichoic acid export membrane protein
VTALRDLRKLASESLIYGVPGIVLRFLSAFLVPLYTRVFTPAEYGVVGLVSSVQALLALVAMLALDNSTARWYYDTEDAGDRRSTFASWTWTYLAATTATGAAVFVAAGFLSRAFFGSDAYRYAFQLAAVTLPSAVLSSVLILWFRVQRRAWAAVLTTIAVSVLTILATVVLVAGFHRGIAGVFLGQLIGNAAAVVIAVIFMRSWLSPRWFRWSRIRSMLGYGLPLIPAGLGYWMINLSDRFFVNQFRTTGEVGLYTVAGGIAAVTYLGTSAFQMAWGPFAFAIHQRPHAKQVFANALLGYSWVACLAASAVSILAPEVIRVLATERYAGASIAVPTLAFSYVMYGAYYIAAIGPGIVKRTQPVGMAVTLAALVNILLNLLLIPSLGIVGAGTSTMLSFALMAAYLFARSQSLYPIPYRFAPVVGLAICSFVVSTGAERWQPSSLWLGVVGKVALLSLFVPAAFLFKFLTISHARALLRGSSTPPEADESQHTP